MDHLFLIHVAPSVIQFWMEPLILCWIQLIQEFGHGFGDMVLPFPHQTTLIGPIGELASDCRARGFIKIWIVHWGVTFAFVAHQNNAFTVKGGIVIFDPANRQDTDRKQNRSITHHVNHNDPKYT